MSAGTAVLQANIGTKTALSLHFMTEATGFKCINDLFLNSNYFT